MSATNHSPPVTVLMAVYNGERYLEESVESILEQEFTDFEFLIVDDASTDGTAGILEGFDDGRIRVLRNARNLGLTRSLNRGLKAARGRFVARLDADDRSRPARLQKQRDYLESHPECAVVGSHAAYFRPSEVGTRELPRPVSHEEVVAYVFFSNPFCHSGVMFRARAVRPLGGYDPSFRRAQDYDLWLRVLAHGWRLHILPEVLVERRVHGESVSSRQPGALENCRVRALQGGLRRMLGMRADADVLALVQELDVANDPRLGTLQRLRLVLYFWRLYSRFCRIYNGSPRACRSMAELLGRLLRRMHPGGGLVLNLTERVVFGRSLSDLPGYLARAGAQWVRGG